jgi:hypothetical protein
VPGERAAALRGVLDSRCHTISYESLLRTAERTHMGLSYRMLLLDEDDRIYWLAVTKFQKLLTNPATHRYPLFAGKRMRAVGAFVELVDRKPTEVVRTSFHILAFDQTGCFDAAGYRQQEFSRAEIAMTPALAELVIDAGTHARVVKASSRFTAQGGHWVPSRALARAINDAALGRLKCSRL